MKIVITGKGNTGKTCLVKRYVHGTFSEKGTRISLGAEFTKKPLEINGTSVMLQLWDVVGQENVQVQSRIYYSGAQGALVVCDATRPDSKAFAARCKADLEVHCPNIPAVLVVNKIDLLGHKESLQEGELEAFCAEHKFHSWVAVSAKTGECVDKPFWDVANAVWAVRNGGVHDAGKKCDSLRLERRRPSRRRDPEKQKCCDA